MTTTRIVFQRKIGQAIWIGQDIQVKVLAVDLAGKVRIGIDAPKEIIVDRDEIRNLKMFKNGDRKNDKQKDEKKS